jgi:hypothetical protein
MASRAALSTLGGGNRTACTLHSSTEVRTIDLLAPIAKPGARRVHNFVLICRVVIPTSLYHSPTARDCKTLPWSKDSPRTQTLLTDRRHYRQTSACTGRRDRRKPVRVTERRSGVQHPRPANAGRHSWSAARGSGRRSTGRRAAKAAATPQRGSEHQARLSAGLRRSCARRYRPPRTNPPRNEPIVRRCRSRANEVDGPPQAAGAKEIGKRAGRARHCR